MTNPTGERIALVRRKRLILIAVITAAVELGLALTAHFGPAFAILIRPVYIIVAVIGAITTWNAARRRPGRDRRHADRRGHASPSNADASDEPSDHRPAD